MVGSGTILLVLSVSGLSACTSWQVQNASPQQVLAQYRPTQVRITRTDTTEVVLREPRITGDTIYGATESSAHGAARADRNAVALDHVNHVALRKTDTGKTTLLALGSAAVASGVGFVIWAASMPDD